MLMDPYIASKLTQWATFLSHTVHAYLHSAGSGKLWKLTDAAKNSEKTRYVGARSFKVIELAQIERTYTTSY